MVGNTSLTKAEVCAKYSVHKTTFDKWKKKVNEAENFDDLCALMGPKSRRFTAEESAMIQWLNESKELEREAIMAKVYSIWPHRMQQSRATVLRWANRFVRRWKLINK